MPLPWLCPRNRHACSSQSRLCGGRQWFAVVGLSLHPQARLRCALCASLGLFAGSFPHESVHAAFRDTCARTNTKSALASSWSVSAVSRSKQGAILPEIQYPPALEPLWLDHEHIKGLSGSVTLTTLQVGLYASTAPHAFAFNPSRRMSAY